jgi:hypothetical protein
MTGRRIGILVLLLVVAACGRKQPPEDAAYNGGVRTLAAEGPMKALEQLRSLGDPVLATRTVNRLILHLYWEKKDLPKAVVLARAGLGYADGVAKALDETDPPKALEVRKIAREIAFDLAGFTWPGGEGHGGRISGSEREAGLKAARLSLTLSEDLSLGSKVLADSCWILGAHLLIEEEYGRALRRFEQSAASARLAGDVRRESLAEGYAGIAMLLGGDDAKAGDARFRAALGALRESDDAKSRGCADELERVLRRFVRRGDAPPVTVTCGALTLEIRSSRTARVYALAEDLSTPSPAFAGEIRFSTEERAGLDRFAGILSRSPTLPEFFLTTKGLPDALFAAAESGAIEPSEANELGVILAQVATKSLPLLQERKMRLDGIAEIIDAKKLARKEAAILRLWTVPAAEGATFCRVFGRNLVLGVAPETDPNADLLAGITRALKSPK